MPRRAFALTPGFIARLAGALVFGWLVMMLAMGWRYMWQATHVTCPSMGAAPAGFAAAILSLNERKVI